MDDSGKCSSFINLVLDCFSSFLLHLFGIRNSKRFRFSCNTHGYVLDLHSNINRPVLIYDDKCSSCTTFARYAFKCCRGHIDCIGHYSEEGKKFRRQIFPPNYDETKMFWIITTKKAYGGRTALLPLLGLIIKSRIMRTESRNWSVPEYCFNSQLCANKKFIIKRLYNLLKKGKSLNINYVKSIND